MDDLTEHGPPGSSAEQQALAQVEGIEEVHTIKQEDLDVNTALFQRQQTTPLLQIFGVETNRAPDRYRELMRGLNAKQKQVISYHRRWCKDAVVAMKKGEAIKPYRILSVVLVE